ncbi:MAG: recombinase family protein [Oscillospiraceae bacterium]|nr:recombinase family protein [Oscillospiraceae bacterium]
MDKRTALYCRTATPDAAAIAQQRAALQSYAGERAFGSLANYEDDGCAGANPNRPAFTRLEQDIRDGKVARVLAVSVTRLGRNIEEVLRWARALHDQGVELIILKGGPDFAA